MRLQGVQLQVPGGSCVTVRSFVVWWRWLHHRQHRGGSAPCCPDPCLDQWLLEARNPLPSPWITDAAADPHRCGTCAAEKASKLTGPSM